MPVDPAPDLRFGIAKEELPGLALTAGLVKCLRLAEALAYRVCVKQRRRGCSDEQMLLTLIYSQCGGGGHPSEDRARTAESSGRRRCA